MTTAANNRPKLELAINMPTRVKLLKERPYEGNSAYGSYTLYTVEQNGEEKAFFATPEAHEELSKHALNAGDEIILKKTAFQNGKKVGAKISVEVIQKSVNTKPVTSAVEPEKPTDNLKTIMEKSLQEAVDITRSVQGVPFQNEDIQKIASCLFIARTRQYQFT